MNCKKAKELFSGYLEDWLSNEERKELGDHIDNCEKCAVALNEFERSVSLLRSLPRITVPPFFAERVRHRALAEEEVAEPRTIFGIPYPLRLAGAFVSVALAVFFVLRGTEALRPTKIAPVATVGEASRMPDAPAYPHVYSHTHPRIEAGSSLPQDAELVLDDWVLSDEGARPESYVSYEEGDGKASVTF
ncbi:MAG: zf-HC2 domain-containing protein [Candidatus Eisenbacteria bacterium]|nr:zf-HC2 domain-containing protein [Candidatus Eisenbacteria bacterium]